MRAWPPPAVTPHGRGRASNALAMAAATANGAHRGICAYLAPAADEAPQQKSCRSEEFKCQTIESAAFMRERRDRGVASKAQMAPVTFARRTRSERCWRVPTLGGPVPKRASPSG